VERRLQWGFGRTRPLLEDFLRRDAFGDGERPDADAARPADGAGDPSATSATLTRPESIDASTVRHARRARPRVRRYCPRPPPAEELAALTLGVAARLPPAPDAGAAAMRARRSRSRSRRSSGAAAARHVARRRLRPVVAVARRQKRKGTRKIEGAPKK
jgi:hypothetical protein